MNEKYHYHNLYLHDDMSDKGIDRNIYNGKSFLFSLKNNTFEHYCVHIDENKNYTEFMQHDDLMNYAKNKCSECNSVIKSDCEYEYFKLTLINGKTIDLSSNAFCMNLLLYSLHMAYREAECIKTAIKSIRNDVLYMSASDIHGDIAYYFAIMLINNMNTITVDECAIVDGKKRVHITFSSYDKDCIPTILIGDYIIPGNLFPKPYDGAISYFSDMLLLEFVKYEAYHMREMIISKKSTISHPFLMCGNHDSWVEEPKLLISDLYYVHDNTLYYIRHSFLSTSLIDNIKDVSIYDMYSTEKYTMNISNLTFNILLLKHTNSEILFISTRQESLSSVTNVDKFKEHYKIDAVANKITENVTRVLHDLNEFDKSIQKEQIKNVIWLLGHDASYNVINLTLCKQFTFDDIQQGLTEFEAEYEHGSDYYITNPFMYTKFYRCIHEFDIPEYKTSFSFICVDDFTKSIFKPGPFTFAEDVSTLSFLKILKIFNKHHINEILPYALSKKPPVPITREYKDKIMSKYIKYIHVFKDFVKNLTHDDIQAIRKVIAPKYIYSRFNPSVMQYFNPNRKYQNKDVIGINDKLFETITSHSYAALTSKTDKINILDDNDGEDEVRRALNSIFNVEAKPYLKYRQHIPRSIFMFDNHLSATHSFQNPSAAKIYGNEMMILDLEKLIDNGVHVKFTATDRGVLYNMVKYAHLKVLPSCIVNDIIAAIQKNNAVCLQKLHDIYVNDYDDNKLKQLASEIFNAEIVRDEFITKKMFTNEMSDDEWKWMIFKLFIYLYRTKFITAQCYDFIYDGLIELFVTDYLSNVDKLLLSHAIICTHFFFVEYIIDLNGDLSTYFENMKVHSPKMDNVCLTKDEIIEIIQTTFHDESEYKLQKWFIDALNAIHFDKNSSINTYNLFTTIYRRHRIPNELETLMELFNVSYFQISDAFTEAFVRIINEIYKLHSDLTEYQQFTDENIQDIKNILHTHSQKVTDAIIKVISNDTFDYKMEDEYTRYKGGTYYYFFDEKYVSEYPTQYSLFWHKDIYNNAEAIYSTLSGGNATNKRRSSFIIAIILAVILLVIGLVVYYCSTINWHKIIDYNIRCT